MVAVLTAVALALAWLVYEAGRTFAGFEKREASQELVQLTQRVSSLQKENETLRSQAASAERQLQIESAVHVELAKQIKAIGDENARLKEDVAFFQSLMSAGGKNDGISIYRFKVERDKLPGEYRYGLLLVQTDHKVKAFQGNLQFVVNLQHNGRRTTLTLPEDNKKNSQAYSVSFKRYQRVEGTFRVAPEAVVESLQVRVYTNGASEAKLTQTVNLS